ncbi:hypothetical protein FFF34_012060 [Inquilinus sp. KBS0705]|nr:hypothetical protein FFF34_012060 [Inquilinus sp. KBS0705]
MVKHLLRALKVYYFVAALLLATLNGYAQKQALADTTDTATIATRRINRDFNNIYLQNLRPSFFGQELFQPLKTMLVGDITANFVMFNTPKSRFFFDVEARVKLRLLSARGAPVKSPSYMPNGTLYYRVNRDTYKPQYLSLSYTHHSNGIRGPTVMPDGSFNRDSGKFSTNFYTLTYVNGKRVDHSKIITDQYRSLALEVHSGLFGTGAAYGLPGKYGWIRLNGGYIYNIAKKYPDAVDPKQQVVNNWQRLQFDFTYIADKYNGYNALNLKKRLNVSLKYYYQFPFMQNVSFLVGGGYRGQDDYNIFFEDSYAYMQFGVASGLSFLFNRH